MTPELEAAYRKLYDTWWNQAEALESDLPGYNLLSCSDTIDMDDAAEAIETLLATQ